MPHVGAYVMNTFFLNMLNRPIYKCELLGNYINVKKYNGYVPYM